MKRSEEQRGGSWSNTIDTVLKDNLVLEIYNYWEGRNYL